jgi:nucleotide-binding universal stress UspA family protein
MPHTAPSAGFLRIVVGYDGSAPASRALDAAVERCQGVVAEELIAVAAGIRDARPGQNVVIVIGSSSHATHRMAGSVAASLARHAPVPLLIMP